MRGKSSPAPEIIGIDHIFLTVSDLERAERFYDPVMKMLDFRKGIGAIGGVRHCHYYNREFAISIRPASRFAAAHDSYAPGLHHLCLRSRSRGAVDVIARQLGRLGVAIEGPRLCPEYAPDYYAVFFNDPDGIRLEVMNHIARRKLIRREWMHLEGFVNPFDKLMRRRGVSRSRARAR
ncbi:MAG TPA: VOC family protein [Candidatus Binataceae bacterium]|nr:VOC family protein [Candidatus Binataceae bacterium]